ncbi:MAG: cobalamin biosynthesis protein CbiG, partial [Actinobacteria bacterium]|nr:cobalamin biosynthesis protein CbiG [Actinomycetota bacterium]
MKTAPFDQIIAVDWSASTKPKRGADSCWIAQARKGKASALHNPPTRQLAIAEVEIMIAEALASGQRSLIGFDASLGYARGLHAQLGLTGDDAWAKLWANIAALSIDGPANANNRFSVA